VASELDVLLDKVDDPALRADLKRQVELLRVKRRFGLVFEEHLPERVQLSEHTVRRGTRVVLRDQNDHDPREVVKVAKGKATVRCADGSSEILAVTDLVVVADFGEPIYPGLRRLGHLKAGGDKPAHVVIKGENHHVLEALQFTHAGKVDCIYIDPPYNSGARDWKYNNDYVDADDAYRHSKWLAFMDRRLRLAKELLNPDDAVLIVAVDEKEYLRLGLLLEQVFRGAVIQMVTVVIKPEGTGRANEFSRTNEFLFFVMLGSATIVPQIDNMYDRDGSEGGQPVEWRDLRRRERTSRRGSRPNQFYAVFVDETSGRIHSVGDPLPDDVDRTSVPVPEGCRAVFPLNPRGEEFIWGTVPGSLRELVSKGYAKADGRAIRFLQAGTIAAIERGDVIVSGHDEQGGVVAEYPAAKPLMPKTVWTREAHNSQPSGTLLLKKFVAGRDFPFPKSLYAVEDALRFFVATKPEAVVVDFFAGSGTTTHAVMRLNRELGGSRQSISITNNEVSYAEAGRLRRAGYHRGDPQWESLGIFEHITRPRIEAAVRGVDLTGKHIQGDYRFGVQFPMSEGLDENVEFFELTYLDPEDVEISAAFAGIAPLLWLRAGGRGEMIEHDAPYYAVMDTYGVLFNPDRWRRFVSDLHDDVRTVFIVTDSPSIFAAVASELPAGVEAVRLYENYLSTFALNIRRMVRLEEPSA
jgi:adenine-specific DNA-methyltransferase